MKTIQFVQDVRYTNNRCSSVENVRECRGWGKGGSRVCRQRSYKVVQNLCSLVPSFPASVFAGKYNNLYSLMGGPYH